MATTTVSFVTPVSAPQQTSVKDFFAPKNDIHHSPPTPTDTGAECIPKRVRFDDKPVDEPLPASAVEQSVTSVPLSPPILPPAIAAMSSDDKINIILDKVCSTDAKISVLSCRVAALEQSAG